MLTMLGAGAGGAPVSGREGEEGVGLPRAEEAVVPAEAMGRMMMEGAAEAELVLLAEAVGRTGQLCWKACGRLEGVAASCQLEVVGPWTMPSWKRTTSAAPHPCSPSFLSSQWMDEMMLSSPPLGGMGDRVLQALFLPAV